VPFTIKNRKAVCAPFMRNAALHPA
jgi:hypothetical protein